MKDIKYQRGSAAREICDVLRKEILTLGLEPGAPLDETALSQRFNVSRSPIREALNRLLVERLVETLPNRSTVVAQVDLKAFPQFIEALDLQQRYATRLAARNRTSSDIIRLRNLSEIYDESIKVSKPLEIMQANFDFHIAVSEAGKNQYIVRHYSELLSEARRLLHIHIQFLDAAEDRSILHDQHNDMVDAIEAKNIEMADQLAHEHTLQFRDRFLKSLHYAPDENFTIDLISPVFDTQIRKESS